MDASDRKALIAAARRFAVEVVAPMVGTEGRDGDLARLPEVLRQAAEVGLLASPDPDAPGYEYGIRGAAGVEHGPLVSLRLLEAVASECAGVALCLHSAGLGARELVGRAEPSAQRVAVAFFAPPTPAAATPWSGDGEVQLDGAHLSGARAFVPMCPESDTFVVYAEGARALVAAEAPGLELREVGARTGLAACPVVDVVARSTPVARLPAGEPAAHQALHWLGLCAIAVGNAQGALAAAVEYAGERSQGGHPIREQPAVQLLLGSAEARLGTAREAIRSADGSLRTAAMLKVRVSEECLQATTDCLQVLGGYGYMEEYRLEKRLRDALTLRSLGGGPDPMLRWIAVSGGTA